MNVWQGTLGFVLVGASGAWYVFSLRRWAPGRRVPGLGWGPLPMWKAAVPMIVLFILGLNQLERGFASNYAPAVLLAAALATSIAELGRRAHNRGLETLTPEPPN